jgi:hypothetical protein
LKISYKKSQTRDVSQDYSPEYLSHCPVGCLNSLVHYKSLLMRHQPENKSALKQECHKMLDKLREIDQKRQQRYTDIGEFTHYKLLIFDQTHDFL